MTVKEYLDNLTKGAINVAAGGQLQPQDADKFISEVRDQNDFFGSVAEVVTVTGSKKNIDTIGLDSRVARKATEGVAPSATVGANFSRRVLTPIEMILPYDVTYDFLEENIEGSSADALLQGVFAKQFSNDMLDLGCNGDEADADAFVSINDGWITTMKGDANTNALAVTAGQETNYKGEIFPGLIKTLPSKFRSNPADLVLLVSPDVEIDYRESLAARATALGDQMLQERRAARYTGIDVVAVPFWPDTFFALTPKKNLKVGISRAMAFETQRQPRNRVVEYTISAKADFEYAISSAIAYANTGA